MKSRNMKGKRSRKPLDGWSALTIQNRGFCALKYEGQKERDSPTENSVPKKI